MTEIDDIRRHRLLHLLRSAVTARSPAVQGMLDLVADASSMATEAERAEVYVMAAATPLDLRQIVTWALEVLARQTSPEDRS
jgi:hypothetical protein